MTQSLNLAHLRDAGLIDASWAIALAPVQGELNDLANFLELEQRSGFQIAPDFDDIMRAFRMPVDAARVLIVGQDPYPTPGHAIGLAFAVDARARTFPRSLSNIFTELEADVGTVRPERGDVSSWVAQGVMLLNRVLTVRTGEAGSHRGRGWEAVTERAIQVLVQRNAPLVTILWGKQAATLGPLLGIGAVIATAHPSPLSARRGFFGSKPFSRTNAVLGEQGADPIDWSAPNEQTPHGDALLY